MDLAKCAKCGEELEKSNLTGKYLCKSCGTQYVKRARCEVCDDELELLEACGAQQFFCNTCKELRSKKTSKFFLKEIQKP